MAESFVFQCPECQRDLTLPTQVAGRTGKCPKCKAVITIVVPLETNIPESSGETTLDLSPPQLDKEDTQSEIADELKKLLEELKGD